MTNALYDKGREAFLNGGVNWTADNIKAVLVDVADYAVNLATHQYLTDVAAAGRVATSANFTGKTTTAGVADAADITLTAVTGDPSEALVIYKDTGTAGTSALIAYIDTATGLPVTPNGGDITVAWDNGANRIFKLRLPAMTLVTENGHPQCSRAECDNPVVPGTKKVRLELRAGDVSTVLTGWAAWWHRNVRSIEPKDGHRNWWAWSATNDVWNSNHLSGSAIDLCADELPWQRQVMPGDQIGMVRRGLDLFEGNVYWGGNWNRVDEMHTQMAGNTYNSPKVAEFAQRLRDGYLNIYGPPDPDQFPLPPGYYYGPLEGPTESISGEHSSDSQIAKDGLGRWQAALGLPVTKKWDDGQTPQAATTMQLQQGWLPNPLFGHGGVYEAEWDQVIRHGWRLPAGWSADDVAEPTPPITYWGDYSQYQAKHVDDTYPYRVISFRASVADNTMRDPGSPTGYAGTDAKWLENMRRAKDMVKRGRLDKIIAYHFWVPGADNWGAFERAIEDSGGVFPELCCMLDVEDGGEKWNIHSDQTPGVKDWIAHAEAYFVNKQATSIYLNFRSNSNLLVGITDLELRSVKLVIPGYHDPNKPPYMPPGIVAFGHQYTDKQSTPPFGKTDMNQAHMVLPMFLQAWGVNGQLEPTPTPPPVAPTVEAGLALIAEQFIA